MRNNLKSLGIAFFITILIAVMGANLVGDGIEWYQKLKKPWYLISFELFIVVAFVYNLLFTYVLFRLFSNFFKSNENKSVPPIIAVVLMMFTNELWNYFFMGLQSTSNAFYGMLLFSFFVLYALYQVKKVDRLACSLIGVYFIWVSYDILWTYALWKLNS